MALYACPSPARDGDHLRPVYGYLSSYAHSHAYLSTIREILVRDAVQSPALMVTLPSFEPERMVLILSKDGKGLVISATCSEQIWGSKKKDAIKVTRHEKIIRRDIADNISDVFVQVTAQTHYPEKGDSGLDGVTYQFSSFVTGFGIQAGQIWSPDSQTICGELVSLGEYLHRYVSGEVTEEGLNQKAEALLARLKKLQAQPIDKPHK